MYQGAREAGGRGPAHHRACVRAREGGREGRVIGCRARERPHSFPAIWSTPSGVRSPCGVRTRPLSLGLAGGGGCGVGSGNEGSPGCVVDAIESRRGLGPWILFLGGVLHGLRGREQEASRGHRGGRADDRRLGSGGLERQEEKRFQRCPFIELVRCCHGVFTGGSRSGSGEWKGPVWNACRLAAGTIRGSSSDVGSREMRGVHVSCLQANYVSRKTRVKKLSREGRGERLSKKRVGSSWENTESRRLSRPPARARGLFCASSSTNGMAARTIGQSFEILTVNVAFVLRSSPRPVMGTRSIPVLYIVSLPCPPRCTTRPRAFRHTF